jgi:hypothetical protein
MLTTLNDQGVRLGRQSSGWGFPPLRPSRALAPTGAGLIKGSGLYNALGRAFRIPPLGAAYALPHSDKPCSYQDDQAGALRGSGLYNASLVGRVVLGYWVVLHQRGLHLAPLCVARDLGWCEHVYPRWGGHTSSPGQHPGTTPGLGSSASIMGSELSSLLGSGPSLCPVPMP